MIRNGLRFRKIALNPTYVISSRDRHNLACACDSTRYNGCRALGPTVGATKGKSQDVLSFAYTSEKGFDENYMPKIRT